MTLNALELTIFFQSLLREFDSLKNAEDWYCVSRENMSKVLQQFGEYVDIYMAIEICHGDLRSRGLMLTLGMQA